MSSTDCSIPPPTLTFSHRSGVTPYTSSCELAGSCVFGKQLPGRLSLRPRAQRASYEVRQVYQVIKSVKFFTLDEPDELYELDNLVDCVLRTRQAISLTYGRLYAEFLKDESLVPLGLLALSTSVGLRYGSRIT